MDRLSVFVRTRRKLVLAVWVALLVVSVPFASQQTKHLTSGGFSVPGSPSAAVEAQIDRFEGQTSESMGVVLEAKGGDLAAAVDRVGAAAREIEHAELAPEIAAQAKQQTADVVLLPLVVDGSVDDILQASKDLREALHVGETRDGVQAYVVGTQALWAGMQEVQQEDLERAEMSGFPAILIVLLAVFGSVLAALLPAGLAIAAVLVTGAVIYFLSLALTMSVFVTNITSMLGIGVAVDYSLFLLSRYREELQAGKSREQALDVAMRTSGATVVFSGVTVLISLAGLFLIDSTAIHSLAIGAMVVVALSIVSAVTLLPALIALLGRRADEPGRIVVLHRRAVPPRPAAQAARDELLGALDERGDEALRALGRAREPRPARALHPRAVAGLRQRRAAPVPGGQRDPPRRRAGGDARPCPARPRRC